MKLLNTVHVESCTTLETATERRGSGEFTTESQSPSLFDYLPIARNLVSPKLSSYSTEYRMS